VTVVVPLKLLSSETANRGAALRRFRGWTGFDGDGEAARGMPRGRSS